MQRLKHTLLATALFAVLFGGFCLDAQAQRQGDGFTSLSIDELIKGVTAELDDGKVALETHTVLKGETTKAARIVFVYGIKHGEEVFGLTVSNPVRLVPGAQSFVTLDGEPLDSPWQAYDDPAFGFEEPLAGLRRPGFDFDNPLIAYDDPAFGFASPIATYDDSARGLENLWETNRTALVKNNPDAYWLVLFTMPDPSSSATSQATIQHSAVIVPFTVTEKGKLDK